MRIHQIVLSSFLVMNSWALGGEPALVPDLEFSIQAGVLSVQPPQGHHFNVKAPAHLRENQVLLPIKLTASKLTSALPANPAPQKAQLDVFVCDTANTYCRKKTQEIAVPPVRAESKAAAVKAAPVPQARATAAAPHFEAETGFYVNDPKKAFALALDQKLPLMIDFFGIWCPPCNHLDAMVFRDAKFKSQNDKRFVRLKLDADQDEFNSLKNRYKIQGLPTVIFATPAGDEIFRLVGYHPVDEALVKADAAFLSREEGFAALEVQAAQGNESVRFKAARIALDRDEPAKALAWLIPFKDQWEKAHDPRLAELYRAQLRVAQASKEDGSSFEAIKIVERWLKEFPTSIDAIENYQTLAELKEGSQGNSNGAAHAALKSALELTDRLLAGPASALKDSEYTRADLAETRADLLEKLGGKLGDRGQMTSAYLACANAYEKEAQAEGGSFARGPSLEKAYCLGKAGKTAESEAIYREGIRRFPEEYTFYQGLARLLLDSGSFARALSEAQQACRHAYGNQRFKATLTLVRAFEALHEPKKAIEAIEEALKSPLAEDSTVGTIKLREKLKAKAENLKKKGN